MRRDIVPFYGTVIALGAERATVWWQDNKRRYYARDQWYRLVPVPADQESVARKQLAAKSEAERARRVARLESRIQSPAPVLENVTERCAEHPTAGEAHECLADEMRCAYCGVRLAPYPCNGCGKFLNAKHMHEAGQGEPWRCEECRGF